MPQRNLINKLIRRIKYPRLLILPLCIFLTFLFLIMNCTHSDDSEESKEFSEFEAIVTDLTEEEISSGELRLPQEDIRIAKYIRQRHLLPPPRKGVQVDSSSYDPALNYYEQQEVYRFILNLLNNQTGGFFIECGANDGEYFSNTMPLELNDKWTGLLIEPDSKPFKRLASRNRNAWLSNTCLSTKVYPMKIQMLRNEKYEGISYIPGYRHVIGKAEDYREFKAQCFPLYSILKAVGVNRIDYFSLDIEGAELEVLKTIPWDKVVIRTLSIEVHPKYVKSVRQYMTSLGFKYITFIKNAYSHDQIYAHPTLIPTK